MKTQLHLENDYISATEVTLQPGDNLLIQQGGNGVIYSLSDCKLKFMQDGKQAIRQLRRGNIDWQEANTYAVENVGKTDARYIAILRKSSVLPSSSSSDVEEWRITEAAADNSRELFKNSHVRITEVRLQPGGKLPTHREIHRVVYSLAPYRVRIASDHVGIVEATLDPGDVHWHDPDNHSVENIGETEAHYLIFEYVGIPPNFLWVG